MHPRLPDGQPDYGRLVPCRCARQRLEESRLQRLQSHSNLGSLTRLTFDNLVPQGRSEDPANQELFLRAYHAATAFAANPEGWLVLTGPSGSGKTHLAAAIVNRRLAEGQRAIFESVPDLLDHLRSTFSPESDVTYDQLFLELQRTPLLVLDNLGIQSSTQWAEEKLFQLIDQRYAAKLPTVISIAGDVSLDSLEERWRTRLTDPGLSQVYQLQKREDLSRGASDHMDLELLKSMTFESFDPRRINLPPEQRHNLEEAYKIARRFAESPEGWLIFQGENGCGKTHLAAAITNYRRRKGLPVRFIVVPDFLDHLRSTYAPDSKVAYDEYFEQVKNAPLLILDDYGEHSSTEWAQEKLYQLISYRYNARLPMVVTMCSSLDEIEPRVSSRLADPAISLVWAILAPDYRTDRPVPKSAPPRPAAKRTSKGRNSGNNGRT
ncbi:MAG: ATP-binding protein [Dehalococcoidia bacterium]|nr:ATP-binding protein [Dehalococcoidia bacterium]